MVVDKSTLKVFSSCCKFFDLYYEAGVYHVERHEFDRKKFPKSDAIYFISPTKQAIQRIIKDFSDPLKPQYGGVHLCFTSHVSDDLLKEIATCKNLAAHVLSFDEINLDFYLYNDNVYYFQKKHILPIFKIIDEDKGIDHPHIQNILNEIAHRLFTVCAIFMEFPYV